MHAFFLYLIEASLGLAAFAAFYWLFLRQLTFFQWSRVYLLGSLLLSLLLPFIPQLPFFSGLPWAASPAAVFAELNLLPPHEAPATPQSIQTAEEASTISIPFQLLSYLLLGLYGIGFSYKAFHFYQHIQAVARLIQEGEKLRAGNYCMVYTRQQLPAFSFLHYIFLHTDPANLSEQELDQVVQHEQLHVDQKHTLDLLFIEMAAILLWFNPAVYYLGTQIREVHEYQADASVSRRNGSTRQYAQLLIKLASQPCATPLLNTFSSRQIFHRISMLTQTKSNPMQKLRFLTVLPAAALTLALCSFLGSDTQKTIAVAKSTKTATYAQEYTIRKISWQGNTLYTDAVLTKALGLKPGDPYTKEGVEARLHYQPDGSDISSLYMNRGYIYFIVEPKEAFAGNAVDLSFVLTEGPQLKIGQIRVKGNTKVSTAELLKSFNIKAGELFDRSKLIKAHQVIAETGLFNTEAIQMNVDPHTDKGTVDLEFILEEK